MVKSELSHSKMNQPISIRSTNELTNYIIIYSNAIVYNLLIILSAIYLSYNSNDNHDIETGNMKTKQSKRAEAKY